MKRCLLFVFIAMLLSACAQPKLEPVPTVLPETVPMAQTETTYPAETVPETTATEPIHSPFYHPDYTPQQIQEYFEEVVLHVEYSDGTGNAELVQKWQMPVGYRISGTPTQEDLEVLETFFTQLNALEGFPGIFPAEENEVEQLRISFLEPDIFRDSFSSVVNGEDAFGATEFWYYTDTNELYSARIGYRTDLDQNTRNSILLEEIVNTLGISDTLLREDSITYQYSNVNLALSDVDWILLKLLYHPDIRCGMDAQACAGVIARLYY